METLLKLFISFFKIGAFSFGGGYAMLPLIKREVIEVHNWMTGAEFIDVLAISEMTPGPFAVNSATFLGNKVAGLPGSIVATFAVILPSFIVMSLLIMFVKKFRDSPYLDWFFTGIRPIVMGLILAAAITVGMDAFIDLKSVILAVVAFYFVTFKELNPIVAIIISGVVGVILY